MALWPVEAAFLVKEASRSAKTRKSAVRDDVDLEKRRHFHDVQPSIRRKTWMESIKDAAQARG